MPSSSDNFPPQSFDVCLAIAGATIFTRDLQTHTRLPEGRYLVLVLYITHGVLLDMAVRWRRFILPGGVAPWLDVRSALFFPSAGATLSFAYPKFEVRPAFVMIGSVMDASVGREPTVDGRLAFMKDVTRLSNSYFGVDRTIDMFMERWRSFHDVDVCISVMFDYGAFGYHLCRVDRRDKDKGEHVGALLPAVRRWRGVRQGAKSTRSLSMSDCRS